MSKVVGIRGHTVAPAGKSWEGVMGVAQDAVDTAAGEEVEAIAVIYCKKRSDGSRVASHSWAVAPGSIPLMLIGQTHLLQNDIDNYLLSMSKTT